MGSDSVAHFRYVDTEQPEPDIRVTAGKYTMGMDTHCIAFAP